MNLKLVIIGLIHLLLISLLILLTICTFRYLASFYSTVDSIGDKKIPILGFLAILSVLIMIGGIMVSAVVDVPNLIIKMLRIIEIIAPMAILFIIIAISIIYRKEF
jgi:hypothetical protein